MNKEEIESILLANWYFTTCRLCKPSCEKTELARKYLTDKIRKALTKKSQKTKLVKALNIFVSFLPFRLLF
jgi:intergrase/recombinase